MKVFFPESPEKLWDLWREYPDAELMAGGTDLLVKVAHRKVRPATILCLEKIGALREIQRSEAEVAIGAAVTHQSLLDNKLVQAEFPVLWKALSVLGSPPIRHAGTIGGNICTASPAGDTLPPLYVLDAQVEIWAPAGNKRMAIGEFITAPGRTVLQQGEILGKVLIPLKWSGAQAGFFKVGHRKALAIAIASLAAVWRTDGTGTIRQVKLAWGSVGPHVMVLPEIEKRLIGQPLTEEVLGATKESVAQGVAPIDDIRASAAYRKQVAGNLLLKLLD